jgi:hypothetical protein
MAEMAEPGGDGNGATMTSKKLTSMRGRGQMHYTETRLYGYFTASNGQGQQEEEDN